MGKARVSTVRRPRVKKVAPPPTHHVYLVIDESASMDSIRVAADRAVQSWVSVVLNDPAFVVNVLYFSSAVRWVTQGYRGASLQVPGIRPGGMTALRDALYMASEHAKANLGEHNTALVLVVTDGGENASRTLPGLMVASVKSLMDTGRADVALMVPPGQRLFAASTVGLDPSQVREWEATEEGTRRAEEVVRASVQSYTTSRSAGNYTAGRFFVDPAAAAQTVARTAARLPAQKVREWEVHKKARIDEFAAQHTGGYVVGEWYYELMKKETIQDHKRVILRDQTGEWYEGVDVRRALGLPEFGDVKVDVSSYGGRWRLFVQSTSTNRNLIPGTRVVQRLP